MCGGGGGGGGSKPAAQSAPASPAPAPAPKAVAPAVIPTKAQDPKSVSDDPNAVKDVQDTNRRKKRAGSASNAGISRLKISSGANVGGSGGSGVSVATPV